MTTIAHHALCLGLYGLVLVSCKEHAEQKTLPSPKVNAVTVGRKDIAVYETYIGQIYGQSDVQIQPRVEGYITGIYFKEGETVEKGKLLYTIDDLPTKSRIDAAAADVNRARSILENKRSELDR